MRLLSLAAVAVAVCVGSADVRVVGIRNDRPGYWTARASFPQLPADSILRRFANLEIAKDSKGQLDEYAKEQALSGDKPLRETVFELRSQISFEDPHVVSVLQVSMIDGGGAHPNRFLAGRTYGLLKGKFSRLRFRDLLRPGVDPVEVYQRLALPRVNESKFLRNAPSLEKLPPSGIESFVVTPKGITWVFSPYDLGAYAEGEYHAKVSFQELAKDLDPAGPLRLAIERAGIGTETTGVRAP